MSIYICTHLQPFLIRCLKCSKRFTIAAHISRPYQLGLPDILCFQQLLPPLLTQLGVVFVREVALQRGAEDDDACSDDVGAQYLPFEVQDVDQEGHHDGDFLESGGCAGLDRAECECQ